MKKTISFIVVFALLMTLSMTAFAGNGAPNGSHYNLNIIGVDKNKTASMDNANGHVIFVPTYGNTCIKLTAGEDFQVLDANGTDEPIELQGYTGTIDNKTLVEYSADGTAEFQLPVDVSAKYQVYVRVPGNIKDVSATITSGVYFTDEYGTWLLMSENPVTIPITSGKHQKFTNVTDNLLFVDCDIDHDGQIEEVPLFYDANKNGNLDEMYFWDYDNDGLKHAQLRFYPVQ